MNIIAKICTHCNTKKLLAEFHIQKSGKYSRCARCKICTAQYKKEYRKNNISYLLNKEHKYRKINREKISINNINYYQNNKNRILKVAKQYYYNNLESRLKSQKLYREINKDKKSRWHKKRLKTDINYRLSCNLRSRLGNIISGKTKAGSAISDLGCSVSDLRLYLEQLFYLHITWENYGKEWEIDHIKPLYSFDLTIRNQFLEACHYTNLQPLLKCDHYSKTAEDIKAHSI